MRRQVCVYLDIFSIFVTDCENESSTEQSLSNIFRCSINDLKSLLARIDIETIYQDFESSPDIPPDEYVLQKVIQAFGANAAPKMICWFHLTRTTQDATFEQGILPLGNALNGIWGTLLNIFNGSEHHQNLINFS